MKILMKDILRIKDAMDAFLQLKTSSTPDEIHAARMKAIPGEISLKIIFDDLAKQEAEVVS